MSVRAIELLRTLGLLDSSHRVADLDQFEEEKLHDLLVYYAKSCAEHAEEETAALHSRPTLLSALFSSISSRNAVQPLLPACLVYDRVFIDDPVQKLVDVRDDPQGQVHRMSLGFSATRTPTKEDVADALAYFQELAPLILDGVVVCLPVDLLHLPPLQRLVGFSEDWFRSSIPEAVHGFVHERAVIEELTRTDRGLIVVPGPVRKPVGGVSVSFAGDDTVTTIGIYMYQHGKITSVEGNRTTVAMSPAWENPPDEEMFRAWVYQSVNLSIRDRLRAISREMYLADQVGASYLTESEFEASLCAKAGQEAPEGPTPVDAVNFLRANEPRSAPPSPELVRQLRAENQELFKRFHESLLDVSGRLAGEADFYEKARQLFRKEIEPQIAEIDRAVARLKVQAVAGAIVTVSSIGLAIASGSVLPLAAIIGFGTSMTIGSTLPSVQEYVDSRNTPAFIWRKMTK